MRAAATTLVLSALAVLSMLGAGVAASVGATPNEAPHPSAASPAPSVLPVTASAQAGPGAPAQPADSPPSGYVSSLAFDPVNGQVYVAYPEASVVTALNGTTGAVAATIPVGLDPTALAVMPGSGAVYVANGGSANLSVISPSTDTVTATIDVGHGPTALALDPQNAQVFVACTSASDVTIVDSGTLSVVGSVHLVGGADAIAYDADNEMVYVGDYSGGYFVSVLNASNDSLAGTIPVHGNPWSLAVDPQTNEVYVPLNASRNQTAVLNGTTEQVATQLTVGDYPRPLVFDPDNGDVYIANIDSYNVSVVAGTTHRVVANVTVGATPYALAVDTAADLVFVANAASDNLSIINGSTNRLLASLPTGSEPAAVAFDPASDTVFVSNYGSSNVSRFSLHDLGGSSTVTLTEVGIPAAKLSRFGWSATVGGVEEHTAARTLVFDDVPEGGAWQLVTGPSGFAAANASERLSVSGALAETVAFSRGKTLTLGWHESGLAGSPHPSWCVELDLLVRCSRTGTSEFRNLTAGAYAYEVLSPRRGENVTAKLGGSALPAAGTLELSRSARIALEFRYPYAVTFSESGLASGPWTVTVGGATRTNASGGPIAFELANGSYRFRVAPVAGYAISASPRTLRVAGGEVAVSVEFHARSSGGHPDALTEAAPSLLLVVGRAPWDGARRARRRGRGRTDPPARPRPGPTSATAEPGR